jgi:[FeFe] hydrogenase H-cluster maturation GTPase HydF
MILPQMQVIRDVLDHDGICVVLKENVVAEYVKKMSPKPVLAITDSQVFPKANAAIPEEIMLTSFSIVLARQKGDFDEYLKGTPEIDELKDGDRILVLESCSHHVTCDDIGRIKIPRWLREYSKKSLEFDVVAGLSNIERPITDYSLIVQCGGCMITRKQIHQRLKPAIDAGIPVTNYGMMIAWVHGIFNRAVQPFTGCTGRTG